MILVTNVGRAIRQRTSKNALVLLRGSLDSLAGEKHQAQERDVKGARGGITRLIGAKAGRPVCRGGTETARLSRQGMGSDSIIMHTYPHHLHHREPGQCCHRARPSFRQR